MNLLTNFFKNLTGSQVDSNSARRELLIKPIYAIRYPSGYQDVTKVSFCDTVDSVTVHITTTTRKSNVFAHGIKIVRVYEQILLYL